MLDIIQDFESQIHSDLISCYKLNSEFDILTDSIKNNSENVPKIDESKLEHIIVQKGDRRLLLNPYESLSEAFFIDLIFKLYPSKNENELFNILKTTKTAKKVFFIIDEYSPIAGTVNFWLTNYFLNYCFHKKFSEFISFDFSKSLPEIKISDLIDFSFIISSRENYLLKKDSQWIQFKEIIYNQIIEPFSESDIKNYIEQNNYKIDSSIRTISDISNGNPYLLLLWLEFYSIGKAEPDTSIIYLKAAERINKYRDIEQTDWLRCASFLDDFDAMGLRCFPTIRKNYKKAFRYLSSSNELTFPSNKNENVVFLNSYIRDIIFESTTIESKKLANEYENIASIYNKTKNIFHKIGRASCRERV